MFEMFHGHGAHSRPVRKLLVAAVGPINIVIRLIADKKAIGSAVERGGRWWVAGTQPASRRSARRRLTAMHIKRS
jgi:hypothetical protein